MTMFGHRKGFERVWAYTGVPGGYWNPPGSQWALMGPSGERGQQASGGARPPRPKPNWFRVWGAAPPFLLPSSSFLLLIGIGKGGQTYLE